MTKFEVALQKEFEDQMTAIKKPNLAIVGGTGVGKSSLINRIFGKNAAKAGVGAPITKGMNRIEDPSQSVPIVFYDTEGYETTSTNEQNNTNFEQNIIPELEKHKKAKEILFKGVEVIQEKFYKAKIIADKAKKGKKINIEELEYVKNMLNNIS